MQDAYNNIQAIAGSCLSPNFKPISAISILIAARNPAGPALARRACAIELGCIEGRPVLLSAR